MCVIRLCRPIFHLPELLFLLLFTHPYTYYYSIYCIPPSQRENGRRHIIHTCRRITLTYSHSENAVVANDPPTRESFVRRQSFDSRKTSNACRCVHSYLSPDRVSTSTTHAAQAQRTQKFSLNQIYSRLNQAIC